LVLAPTTAYLDAWKKALRVASVEAMAAVELEECRRKMGWGARSGVRVARV
jgi:hypothetical protein